LLGALNRVSPAAVDRCQLLDLSIVSKVENVFMPTHTDDDSARDSQKRLDRFLDCLACLLAKRWLREQQQEADPVDDQQQRRGQEPDKSRAYPD
jgi:hypothetical protein